jgi:branched-chain amino acid transport system permease protein
MSVRHETATPAASTGQAVAAASRRQWSPVRLGLLGVLLVIAVLAPFFLDAVTNDQLTRLLVLAIAIVSLNLLAGFSGQISVGHGAFAGLGAYATAYLVADQDWSHLLGLVGAAVICLVAGLIAGLPALRIKGVYLALVTLSLAVVFPTLVQRFKSITGGSAGKSVPQYTSPFDGLAQDQWAYLLALFFTVLVFLLMRNMTRSRVGRALIATRDNAIAGQVVGMPVGRYKVLTFGVSAMIAGIAGSLLVLTVEFPFLDAKSFTLTFSIYLLVGTVVGGATSLVGPFVGALFIDRVPDLISNHSSIDPRLTPLIFGAVLILLIFAAPGGAVGLYERARVALARRTGRPLSPEVAVVAPDAAFSTASHLAEEVASHDIEHPPSGAPGKADGAPGPAEQPPHGRGGVER